MNRHAMEGGLLRRLTCLVAVLCRTCQPSSRSRAGRPQAFAGWQIVTLILIAVVHRRKSKSAQYRFLDHRRLWLLETMHACLGLDQLPARATYMRRYHHADTLLARAIELGGRCALREGVGDGRVVAVDKSLIRSRGRVGRHGRRRRAVDAQADWGRSVHDGWVFGYSYEVVVAIGGHGRIVPLLACVDTAATSEHRSFLRKIPRLPSGVRHVLVDAGYDGNALAYAVAHDSRGRRIARRLIGPMIARGGKPAVGRSRCKGTRELHRQDRIRHDAFFRSPGGRRLYARRKETIEPFNAWLKQAFELEDRVWHRGLANNRTMLLAAIFAYQPLQHLNHRLGNNNGQVLWILDQL